MNEVSLRPGEVGKVFLDFEAIHEGFDGALPAHVIYEDLKDVSSEDEIKRLIERAEELEIVNVLAPGLLLCGPRMHLLREYKLAKGQMPEEHLRSIKDYTFDLNRRSERWRQEFVKRCFQFRDERLRKIEAGDTFYALPFEPPPLVVLHIMPAAPLRKDNEKAYSYLSSLTPQSPEMRPISLVQPLVNGGLVGEDYQTYAYNPGGASAYSYVNVFRNGNIEAVRSSIFKDGPARLHAKFEREVVEALSRLLALQRALGLEPPVGILLTITGARGFHIANDNGTVVGGARGTITSGRILTPVTKMESLDSIADKSEIARVMKDSFDRVWRAAGYTGGSPNYDEFGNLRRGTSSK